MATIKTEGFCVPGSIPAAPRPHFHRPFSDGSMAIETDMLTAIDHTGGIISPFSFAHSLPPQPCLDQFMASPHSSSLDLDNHGFHIFNNYKVENPEPPINFPMVDASEQRARSLSTSRNAAAKVSRRKLSMTDSRPPVSRGRPVHPHPRTMSHSDAFSGRFGLGIGLDTHKEGERTDSISPPEYNPYGITIPPTGVWPSSAPSLVPGSFGSYSYPDEAIMDSPITPAQELTTNDSYKKQRRRECHNQVEKRRREHINAKIEELCQMLPAHYSQEDAIDDEEEEEVVSPAKKKKNKRSGSTTKQKDAAHCKGRILSQSVQYIYDLKHITEMQAARIQHLESLLPSVSQPGFAWPEATFANPPQPMSTSYVGSSLMAFQPSPTEQSSGSANNFRRSSSLSASESLEGMYEVKGGEGCRAMGDVDLQLSMSSMDMDAMMFGRRDDRW